MKLNPESKYPNRRAYVLKLRGDATAEAFAGRIENMVTGRQREFASAVELLASIASDIECSAAERPAGDTAEQALEPPSLAPAHGDRSATQR